MPLYISNQPARRGCFSAPQDRQIPVLIHSNELQMQHRDFPQRFDMSCLMADAFELTNTGKHDVQYPLIPSNCYGIVFQFTGRLISAQFCGMNTSVRILRLAPGSSAFVIRLRPGTMNGLTGELAQDHMDRTSALESMLPYAAEWMQLVCGGESFHERTVIVHQYFKKYFPNAGTAVPDRLKKILEIIDREKGTCRVTELADHSQCSERYLGNLFQKHVGCAPKLFCEIMQMQYSLDEILRNRPKSLAQVAVRYGYFDQPHMNRIYHKLLGRTASEMRLYAEVQRAREVASFI